MRRKLAAVVAVLMLAGATGALAQPGNGKGPDPNGPAKYGLCVAYFANGGNGNSHNTPPFQNLEEAAEGEEGDTPAERVANFCDGTRPGNGQGNGSGNSQAPNPIP